MLFKDAATALKFLSPSPDQAEMIHAAKNFKVVTGGDDELLVWLMQTLSMMQTIGLPMARPCGTARSVIPPARTAGLCLFM